MGRTILVADDSPTIRKIVELTFSDSGYRVETAGGGTEAVALLGALAPDVVLADVVMPEPSGYDLCRAVKASERPVPVLLLAGTFEPFDAGEARRCGADGHLVKPFESRALRDKVEQLLAAAAAAAPPAAAEPAAGDPVELDAALAEAGPAPDDAVPAAPPVEAVPARPSTVDPGRVPGPGDGIRPELIEAVSREVVRHLGTEVLREIAWEVVPKLAGELIRERIRELEREVDGE